MSRKSPLRIEAERLCSEMPKVPTRTLAKRLAEEFGCTIESARNAVRNSRGNRGKESRKTAATPRKKGKSGWAPKMPPSQAEDWVPFEISGKRVGVLSDIHIPFHSEKALGAAIKQFKKDKIDFLLLNGDAIDYYSVSRWEKDPRKRSLKNEVELAKQFLEWIRHEFRRIPIVFKLGNHEERWDKYLWNHAPEICDLEQVQIETVLELDKHGVELVRDQRPVMAGKLPIFHGHELPKGLTNPVNMARGAFLRMIDTVMVGHGHRSSSHTESTWSHQEITCWSTGCLCTLHPDYARINKWNWGMAQVEIGRGGEFNVANMRISKNGSVRKS